MNKRKKHLESLQNSKKDNTKRQKINRKYSLTTKKKEWTKIFIIISSNRLRNLIIYSRFNNNKEYNYKLCKIRE